MAGLWGAIAVGLLAALFGGTPAQISGPTALVLAAALSTYAFSLEEAFMVVVCSGLMQVALGVLRLGRHVNLMPYPVISGWLSGIGLTIILVQLGPLVGRGDDAPEAQA